MSDARPSQPIDCEEEEGRPASLLRVSTRRWRHTPKRGNGVVLGGEFSGVRVAYLATDGELGVITEIFSGTPSGDLKPDGTYPDARTARRDSGGNWRRPVASRPESNRLK